MSQQYIKPKPWKGENLTGDYMVTLKIDGVRMLRDKEGNPVSRNGKPLYNLSSISPSIVDAEIYYGDWESSIHHVRSSVSDVGMVSPAHVYSLFPKIDPRLIMGYITDPTKEEIEQMLYPVVAEGYEGLVLRRTVTVGEVTECIKVKPKETYDVKVLEVISGKGKFSGMMGALVTERGNIGTGFTEKERIDWWNWALSNASIIMDELTDDTRISIIEDKQLTIEVDCTELTKNGMFRHPRFIRIREDK